MLLIAHITIALLSMLATALVYVWPSRQKLRISYGLVALTLTSGTVLVVVSHSPLLKACLTGLLYLGVVFGGIIAARYRMAAQERSID